MATFKSHAYIGGIKFRPIKEGKFEITSTVKIPAGRALANNDVIKFLKLGADVEVLSATLRCDKLEDGAGTNSTLDLGTFAGSGNFDVDGILDGSIITRAGGIIRVENGGDDPFAAAFPATDQTVDVQAIFLAGTPAVQTVQGALDRYLTLTLECAPKRSAVPATDPAYIYADRYTGAVSST
jgi:hypothetical protein